MMKVGQKEEGEISRERKKGLTRGKKRGEWDFSSGTKAGDEKCEPRD